MVKVSAKLKQLKINIMNKEHIKALKLLDKYFKETPKKVIEKEIELISDLDIQGFALTLTDVVVPKGTLCEHPFDRISGYKVDMPYCNKCRTSL